MARTRELIRSLARSKPQELICSDPFLPQLCLLSPTFINFQTASPTPADGDGAGATNPQGWGNGVGDQHRRTEVLQGKQSGVRLSQTSDVHAHSLLMTCALSWLRSAFLQHSPILPQNLPFFSLRLPYFP